MCVVIFWIVRGYLSLTAIFCAQGGMLSVVLQLDWATRFVLKSSFASKAKRIWLERFWGRLSISMFNMSHFEQTLRSFWSILPRICNHVLMSTTWFLQLRWDFSSNKSDFLQCQGPVRKRMGLRNTNDLRFCLLFFDVWIARLWQIRTFQTLTTKMKRQGL